MKTCGKSKTTGQAREEGIENNFKVSGQAPGNLPAGLAG